MAGVSQRPASFASATAPQCGRAISRIGGSLFKGPNSSAAGASIASERKARPAPRVTGRALSRNQAEEGHQLRRRIEAAYIPDLSREDHCDQERCTAHRLIGLDERRHRPGRHDGFQLLVQAT
jgi:hypothetical protein